ncbi:glycosyltransferase family 4 protein [Methanolobus chelungpuianus]|uniref:LPS biosynthesis protein n=1 Tax=Methanolobus chelungpuianus TaxID=502115 RepID=A0AAE3HAX1_9EURY|nr:glycosyltransferase family 4 protein [Methanolobus chelungpuianus]MCQ6962759.1 LPS biosynthesis protein [Methanolobus chelungpuianus]
MEKVLRIAQVCPRYSPDIGGVETHVREISERLVKSGHQVEVITTDPTGELKESEVLNGVKVTRFRSLAPGNAYYLAPQIYTYLRQNDFDIVHAHSYHALPALFAILAKPKGKLIFTPHYHRSGHTQFRNVLHKPYRSLGKLMFSRADKVICVSEYERELLCEDFRISDKVVKIPNGVNLDEFKHLQRKQKETDEKVLLYIGRLEEYKGVQYAISALPSLPGFRLQIVGKGPYEDDLREQAEELHVSERIQWLKDLSREDILHCYAQADVFLMLSRHEAYGITVAEALAAGTPCVVARGSALDEFVDGEMCLGIQLMHLKCSTLAASVYSVERQAFDKTRNNINLFDWNHVVGSINAVYCE